MRMGWRDRGLGAVAALVLVLCGSPAARAQILIEEGKIFRNVRPGETVVGTLRVHNTSRSRMLRLRAYWQDFEYVPPYDGTKTFLPAGSTRTSCADWVGFAPETFDLEPGGVQEVRYTIRVPQDVRGGHYGVLFFEAGGSGGAGELGMSIVARVGTLFFLETVGKHKTADLREIAASGKEVTAVFVNTGDVILLPRGLYYVMDAQGRVLGRGKIPRRYLPPGAETPVSIPLELDKDRPAGILTIVATFDLEEGVALVREIDVRRTPEGDIVVVDVRR